MGAMATVTNEEELKIRKNERRAIAKVLENMSVGISANYAGRVLLTSDSYYSDRLKQLNSLLGVDLTLQQEVTGWANELFPNRDIHGCVHKLTAEEFPEFLMAVSENDMIGAKGEIADVLFMLFDIASFLGIDVEQAVREKLEINKRRKWEKTEAGTYKHVE